MDILLQSLQLLGSLGLFIYGMKVMSEGLQKAAGKNMRKILSGMTSNRFMGVFSGFLVTALIQSSSATTVMVVSFVNAGLLTLFESMGVIMGANIGTTVTSWLVYYFGFKVSIVTYAIPMIGLAFPFLFSKRSNFRHIAEFVVGFGILFIGLDFLKGSVPDIKHNPEIMEYLTPLTSFGFMSVLIFVGVGILLTIVVQSSSASLAITLVMVAQGWIQFELAAAMFIGGNIGTTVTAILASSVGNIYAKRTALFHLIFNILGSVWILVVFNSFLHLIDNLIIQLFNESPFSPKEGSHNNIALLGLSIFHTTFNLINTFVLVGFIPILEKLVVRLMPSKKTKEEYHLQFISTGLMSTPELSLEQAKKEVQYFGKIIDKLCLNIKALLFEKFKESDKLAEKIKEREDVTDTLEIEISSYLGRLAEGEISKESSQKIRSMLRMVSDLERIGDIIYQMMLAVMRMKESKIDFPEDVKSELQEMFDVVYDSIKQMRTNLDVFSDSKKIIKAVYATEEKVNKLRDKLQKAHFQRLEEGKYSFQAGVLYLDLVSSLEKIGDHVVNINESIAGMK